MTVSLGAPLYEQDHAYSPGYGTLVVITPLVDFFAAHP